MNMVFKKELWLEQINREIEQGLHTERDKNDALEIWVNDLDGQEIDENDEQNAWMIKFCE